MLNESRTAFGNNPSDNPAQNEIYDQASSASDRDEDNNEKCSEASRNSSSDTSYTPSIGSIEAMMLDGIVVDDEVQNLKRPITQDAIHQF